RGGAQPEAEPGGGDLRDRRDLAVPHPDRRGSRGRGAAADPPLPAGARARAGPRGLPAAASAAPAPLLRLARHLRPLGTAEGLTCPPPPPHRSRAGTTTSSPAPSPPPRRPCSRC